MVRILFFSISLLVVISGASRADYQATFNQRFHISPPPSYVLGFELPKVGEVEGGCCGDQLSFESLFREYFIEGKDTASVTCSNSVGLFRPDTEEELVEYLNGENRRCFSDVKIEQSLFRKSYCKSSIIKDVFHLYPIDLRERIGDSQFLFKAIKYETVSVESLREAKFCTLNKKAEVLYEISMLARSVANSTKQDFLLSKVINEYDTAWNLYVNYPLEKGLSLKSLVGSDGTFYGHMVKVRSMEHGESLKKAEAFEKAHKEDSAFRDIYNRWMSANSTYSYSVANLILQNSERFDDLLLNYFLLSEKDIQLEVALAMSKQMRGAGEVARGF